MLAMNMAMGDFFCSGCAHADHFHADAQGFTRQRVIAIEHDLIALDFKYGKNLLFPRIVIPFQ